MFIERISLSKFFELRRSAMSNESLRHISLLKELSLIW